MTADTNSSPDTTGNLGMSDRYGYVDELPFLAKFIVQIIDVNFDRFSDVCERFFAVSALSVTSGQAGTGCHDVPVLSIGQGNHEVACLIGGSTMFEVIGCLF